MHIKEPIPGFKGHIRVLDLNKNELYKQKITSQKEADLFLKTYGDSVAGSSALRSSFIPTRTHSWEALAKDVFLPTFFNHALEIHNFASKFYTSIKVNNFVLKLIVSIFALAWDALTLAPRLIATPFKIYHDSTHAEQPPHPLVTLIKKNTPSANSNALERLTIRVRTQTVTIEPCNDSTWTQLATTQKNSSYRLVNTSVVPGIVTSSGGKTISSCHSYDRHTRTWVQTGVPSVMSHDSSFFSA